MRSTDGNLATMPIEVDLPPERVSHAVAGGAKAAARFVADLDGLDDEAVHAPSLLPGWTRAMVCAHVTYVAERLAAAQSALDERWAALPADAWATVRHDPELGPMLLGRLPLMRWKEAEVHRTDLGIPGADPAWAPDYAVTELPLRIGWLASHQRPNAGPATPDGRWSIVATDLGRAWEVTARGPHVDAEEVGTARAPVAVSGTAADVLAALLGRGPLRPDPALRAAFPGP